MAGGVPTYDALLVVSFGGPEGMGDVRPFLASVTGGARIPEERLREVARHYERFGGKSPINAQNRALVEALRAELASHGPELPVYWGNRHFTPFLKDALEEMAAQGVRRALAFVTSAFSSYPGCRAYLEAIARARAEVGEKAPEIAKLRGFYNHPGFIGAVADRAGAARDTLPEERRARASLVYTAHSIPLSMAATSDYEAQLREACGLVSGVLGVPEWSLAFQSRSGPPSEPWLGPDIAEHLRSLRAKGARDVVVVPIGLFSDHMEVVYDLDVAAKAVADEIGLSMVRAGTPGIHRAVVAMIAELVRERTDGAPRRFLGSRGPRPDACAPDCCPPASGRVGGERR